MLLLTERLEHLIYSIIKTGEVPSKNSHLKQHFKVNQSIIVN